MPRPPLGRSNNDDRRQRRKQGGAVGAAASRMRGPHQGPKQMLGAATRAVARRRRDGEVSFLRQGSLPSNLSVTFGDSSPCRGATGVSVRPTRDEQSSLYPKTAVPCYRGQQLRDNIPCQAAVNLCSRALYFTLYQALGVQHKAARHAKGSPSGRAVTEGD